MIFLLLKSVIEPYHTVSKFNINYDKNVRQITLSTHSINTKTCQCSDFLAVKVELMRINAVTISQCILFLTEDLTHSLKKCV